jgi:ADP-ribose pyrophosphatase YjhB (NUDIX family)
MRQRVSVRAVLVDPADRILLFRYNLGRIIDPARPQLMHLWGTPGGGVNHGEDLATALRRELVEETGLTDVDVVREVWRGRLQMPLPSTGEVVLSIEHYFLARTQETKITVTGMAQDERDVIATYRWWELKDICASTEIFGPRKLAEYLSRIRNGEFASAAEVELS